MLDVHTVIYLLFLGNLTAVCVFLAFRGRPLQARAYRFFMASKILEALGWLLIGLRGHLPPLLSIEGGNLAIILGAGLEALALTTARVPSRDWERAYAGLALAGVAGLGVLRFLPLNPVTAISAMCVVLCLTASAAIFRNGAGSVLYRFIGTSYALSAVAMGLRAWTAQVRGPSFGLFTPGPVQSLAFAVLFIQLLLGGIAFLLMLKEAEDERMRESESKYRTLVERAQESIIIIQELRVVFANPSALRLLDVPEVGPEGLDLQAFIDPCDWGEVLERHLLRLVDEGPEETYDLRLRNSDGRRVWVSISATKILWRGAPAVMAMMTDIDVRKSLQDQHEQAISDLRTALAEVRTLKGLIPICASCKKIRDDQGYWNQIETYIIQRTDAVFTHGVCPECREKLFPDHLARRT